MDVTGWMPVTDGSGAVLGWMADPSAEIAQELAARRRAMVLRAGRAVRLAGLVPDPSFDADAAVAAGVTWAELDSASYVALVLAEAELSAGD